MVPSIGMRKPVLQIQIAGVTTPHIRVRRTRLPLCGDLISDVRCVALRCVALRCVAF